MCQTLELKANNSVSKINKVTHGKKNKKVNRAISWRDQCDEGNKQGNMATSLRGTEEAYLRQEIYIDPGSHI